MAEGEEEVRIARIIACFAPGSAGSPEAVARLAAEMQVELLGLFIEDVELLRFAALPFAAEVGFPSAARRSVDLAGLERQLHAQAAGLRQALATALDPTAVSWSFRVARGSRAEQLLSAATEGGVPTLLVPPGTDPRAEPAVVSLSELTEESSRELLDGAQRPILILP